MEPQAIALQRVITHAKSGWGGRIRTYEWRDQNPKEIVDNHYVTDFPELRIPSHPFRSPWLPPKLSLDFGSSPLSQIGRRIIHDGPFGLVDFNLT
jgi:hypothetical protein